MSERTIETNGVEICAETFGDPADPPVLLIMGIGASMLWWEDDFCGLLAGRERFVIRYDHRDTGRSTTYAPGHPGYTGRELTADAVGVLDAFGLPSAHLVGVSAGGGIAQEIALDAPERVLSLTLISTSPATGARDLPSPAAAFGEFVATATVDWSQRTSVVEYLVSYQRVLAGRERPFDEMRVRDLVRRDVARARDFRAAQNHEVLDHGSPSSQPLLAIDVPTLVLHGTADPVFPIEHGEALADGIPRAKLVRLDGAGHGLAHADWATVAEKIVGHTAAS